MKLSKIVLLAMIFAFVTVGMAQAGTQVQLNQNAEVKAAVKNTTGNTVRAAVKLTGYDDVGTAIGHLCQETYLAAGQTTDLAFTWQAPSYATGIYWSPKVEVGGSCANQDSTTSYDSDSDSDSDGSYYDYH